MINQAKNTSDGCGPKKVTTVQVEFFNTDNVVALSHPRLCFIHTRRFFNPLKRKAVTPPCGVLLSAVPVRYYCCGRHQKMRSGIHIVLNVSMYILMYRHDCVAHMHACLCVCLLSVCVCVVCLQFTSLGSVVDRTITVLSASLREFLLSVHIQPTLCLTV